MAITIFAININYTRQNAYTLNVYHLPKLMYHCRALFMCIQSVWRPKNDLACKQRTSADCNRAKLPSAGHWQAVGLEIHLMYGRQTPVKFCRKRVDREKVHGSFSMICCYCLCDSNNNNNLSSSFQANSFCKLWALKMFVCCPERTTSMTATMIRLRLLLTRNSNETQIATARLLFWHRVLCKQKSPSIVESSRQHRRQTPDTYTFWKTQN